MQRMQRYPAIDSVPLAARRCHPILENNAICHAIMGGLAMYLHGNVYRKPRDADLLICIEDADAVKQILHSAGYGRNRVWDAAVDPEDGVRVDVHWDGKQVKINRKKTITLRLPTRKHYKLKSGKVCRYSG